MTDATAREVNMVFGFRTYGRDHELGNVACPGCDPGFPQPHRGYPAATCLGLIHAETFVSPELKPETIHNCDVCYTNPLRLLLYQP